MASDQLFAVQGWLPEERAPSLPEALARTNLPAAVDWMKPADDEQPPTLIRSPAWRGPSKDCSTSWERWRATASSTFSVPFLIALPIFTAILISDGGMGRSCCWG